MAGGRRPRRGWVSGGDGPRVDEMLRAQVSPASARRAARGRSRTRAAGSRGPVRHRADHPPRVPSRPAFPAGRRARRAPPRSRYRGRGARRHRPRPPLPRRPPRRPRRGRRPGAGVRSSCRAPWLLTMTPSTPCVDRDPGVLGGEDPLENERETRPRSDRREVAPGRRGERVVAVDAVDDVPRVRLDAMDSRWRSCQERGARSRRPQIPFAIAEHREVDGQDDRAEPCSLGPLDEGSRDARIALEVELEPAGRVGGCRGHLLDRPGRHRRQRERHAGGGGRPARPPAPHRDGRSTATDIGAIATGIAAGAPSSVVDGSTDETSTRTRGRNRRRRHAASFSARLSSSHAPPAT